MAETNLEHLLLQKIAAAQLADIEKADLCTSGIFLSERFHRFLPLSRPDDNVFFTASVLFLLQLYRPLLSAECQLLADQISRTGTAAYPLYQNKHSLDTYNFYRTRPSGHFPNGLFMQHLPHFELPDDADDTALIYLTQQASTKRVQWLKQKLQQHANLSRLQVKTTLPEARDLPAYSTWFGKNMPIEFDACVLSNLLFLFFQHNLPLNGHDNASLQFLHLVISSDAHFNNPYQVAPAYPNTAIILYHIIRLVSRFEIEPLQELKQKLSADVERASKSSNNFMELIILDTCRMRLGGKPRLQIVAQDLNRPEVQNFGWFTAAFLSPFANPLLHWLAKYPLLQMKFSCPALSYALLLEHELNRKLP